MFRLGFASVFALSPLIACMHQQARGPAHGKAVAVESTMASTTGAADSGSVVESAPHQATDSIDSHAADFPKACTSICEPNFWECRCAFALKSGINPECANAFAVDHGTRCVEETIEDCLGTVLNRANARYDRELAQATTRALDCLHEAEGS